MGDDYLRTRLLLPMAGGAALALLVSAVLTAWDEALTWSGWAQALTVEAAVIFAGVLLTVWYVDRELDQHKEQQWEPVKVAIKQELRHIASVAISETFATDPLSGYELTLARLDEEDIDAYAAYVEGRLDETLSRVYSVIEETPDRARSLTEALAAAEAAYRSLLAVHVTRMDPSLAKAILEAQQATRAGSSAVTLPFQTSELARSGLLDKRDGDVRTVTTSALKTVVRTSVALLRSLDTN